MVWDIKRCMKEGEQGQLVNLLVRIVGVGTRSPYKNDPKKALQQFDVFVSEYQGAVKTKRLKLFNAPNAEECASYVGKEMIAKDTELGRKPNEHKPGETYLSEMATRELITIETYESMYGASAVPEQGEATPNTQQGSTGGNTFTPSNGNGLSNDEMKAGVNKVNRFLMHQFDAWLKKYGIEKPTSGDLQKLAVTAAIMCQPKRYFPDYDPAFQEPIDEGKAAKIAAVNAQAEAENQIAVLEEPSKPPARMNEPTLEYKRNWAANNPERLVACTDCKEEMPVKLLSITEDGAFCAKCDKIPF